VEIVEMREDPLLFTGVWSALAHKLTLEIEKHSTSPRFKYGVATVTKIQKLLAKSHIRKPLARLCFATTTKSPVHWSVQ